MCELQPAALTKLSLVRCVGGHTPQVLTWEQRRKDYYRVAPVNTDRVYPWPHLKEAFEKSKESLS